MHCLAQSRHREDAECAGSARLMDLDALEVEALKAMVVAQHNRGNPEIFRLRWKLLELRRAPWPREKTGRGFLLG